MRATFAPRAPAPQGAGTRPPVRGTAPPAWVTMARPGYSPAMDFWDLTSIDVTPHQPIVLHSDEGAARAIAINLPAGEELQEHEVHEHAYVIVADGEVQISQGGESITAGPGVLAHFVPQERHDVKATSDARLLLILAPWPGPGHPNNRTA
jgi:quercetin dioxygenase-like cupin family protein